MKEIWKMKSAPGMCSTLKETAQDDNFKRACEIIRRDQKVRLQNGWYDYTGIKNEKQQTEDL